MTGIDSAEADLRARAEADGVEFFFAMFVDMHGKPCAKMIPVQALHVLTRGGAGFAFLYYKLHWRLLGIVPQEINFNMFETPFTIVVNQAGFYGIARATARERAEKYLRQLQLWDKRNSMSRGLSGGMKRRLMIARALMHEPRLLILDEPTAALGAADVARLFAAVRRLTESGAAVIFISHRLQEVEALCESVLVLRNGRDVSPGLYQGGNVNTEAYLDEGDVIAFSGPVPYSFGYGAPVV